MLMISLYLWEALLKVHFQDASVKFKPLFSNKVVLSRTLINIKSHFLTSQSVAVLTYNSFNSFNSWFF